jgi:hypothetical protein
MSITLLILKPIKFSLFFEPLGSEPKPHRIRKGQLPYIA